MSRMDAQIPLRDAMALAFEHFVWSPETLEAHRTTALRRTVTLAREGSPFYAERLAGIDVDTMTVADLQRVPPTTKDDLVDQFDRIVGDAEFSAERCEAYLHAMTRPEPYGGAYLFASSGSSGRRAFFPMSILDFRANAAAALACAVGQQRASSRPRTSCTVAFGGSDPAHLSAATSALYGKLDPAGGNELMSAGTPLEEIQRRCRELDPTTLMGFVSVIARLARAQIAGELELEPEVVVSIGEPLCPEDLEVIEGAWGCPVHNGYGCSELGWMAMSTGPGGPMVRFDDQFVFEPIGREGGVLGYGSTSTSMYVTPVTRQAFPLVRYELHDRVETLEPDATSGAFARIGAVVGRDDDWFRYDAVEVHPAVFRSVLLREPGIDEYQVVQEPGGARVRAVLARPDVDLEPVTSSLTAALTEAGIAGPRVTVERVSGLERTPGQKLRRFVPLRPA